MKFFGPAWLQNMPEEVEKLIKGENVVIGNKIYSLCTDCNQVICVNKPIFGSAHFCNGND